MVLEPSLCLTKSNALLYAHIIASNALHVKCFFEEVSIMVNREVRAYAIEKGVLLWKVAEAIGISDSSFSRKLRRELPEEERKRILRIIDEIAAEREVG